MSLRLRRAPPRHRRGALPVPLYGFAAVAMLGVAALALREQWHDHRRLVIERLPISAQAAIVAAGSPKRSQDTDLISLPPLAPPRPYLANHRIVSFYGNPLAEALGVLGEQSPEQTIARLRVQADAYARLSDDRTVVPAVHLIYAVAQEHPGPDGSYLLRMDDDLIEQWIRLTRDNGMLLFLDIQVGRSTVDAELPRILKYLANEHVHAALDPEFAWGTDGTPGVDIGHLTAAQVNRAQEMLQRFTMAQGLPTKIVIVHQFLPGMLKDRGALRVYDRVELVIDADGFGPRSVKLGSWDLVIRDANVQLAGIKLFYRHDPDLMSPTDVLNLTPRPAVIIYQ